jgi:hypothetical protein
MLRKRSTSNILLTTDADSATRAETRIRVGESEFPPLITIFSAPNYCDRYQNKAAILRIDIALDDFRVIQYDCVEHPVPEIHESQTDNNILAIIAACPYMPTSFRNFVRLAVELGPEEGNNLVCDSVDAEHSDTPSDTSDKRGIVASPVCPDGFFRILKSL